MSNFGTTQSPVVAVVSPKGGTGKTAIASNLAVAFATRSPVVIADLDVYAGDVEWAFGLRPDYRLDDIMRRLRDDPDTDLTGMFTTYDTNLCLLCAPGSHLSADEISTVDLATIVSRLRSLHRPIVLDTAPGMSESTLDAVEVASTVVLVTTTDVAAVQAARRLLDTLATLQFDSSRVSLAVNRTTSRTGLAVSEVERQLGRNAALTIPESWHLAEGLNAGRPVVESHPDSHIAASFLALVDGLLGFSNTRRTPFWRRKIAS